MLRLFRISPDGVRVETWSAGSEHVVNDNTLAILIGEGACEIVENKAMDAAPENKAQPKRRGRRKAQR